MFTSLIWLIFGGLLQVFGFGLWTIPVAAWFVPLFLLRFSRKVNPQHASLGIWLAFFIANSIANTGSTEVMPYVLYFGIMALIAALQMLPYLADRLIAPRLPGFASTLVLPLAWVTMELINARVNPYGTFGSIAYTQYGNLPLMQLASVTGIAGITFLICWFGSVCNWVWDAHFNWAEIKTGVLIFVGVWCLVMLGGGARLAFASSEGESVRMASIGTQPFVLTSAEEQQVYRFRAGEDLSMEEREQVLQIFGKMQDWFLETARREARAGAKIIAWTETGVPVGDQDEEDFLQRAGELARQEQVYLLMGIGTFHPDGWPLVDNKAVLIAPSGEIIFTYFKTHLVPVAETSILAPGDGSIPFADTPFGRIAAVICYDMDFPNHIVQAGKANVDVLLVPVGDWREIGRTHAHMAEFRALENGVSLVRPAAKGIHSAVDPYGRILATMDEFTVEQRVMVAQVPVRGVHTIYSSIGDLFAWLCVGGLLGAIAWGIRRVRKTN